MLEGVKMRAFEIVLQLVARDDDVSDVAASLKSHKLSTSGLLVLILGEKSLSKEELSKFAVRLAGALDANASPVSLLAFQPCGFAFRALATSTTGRFACPCTYLCLAARSGKAHRRENLPTVTPTAGPGVPSSECTEPSRDGIHNPLTLAAICDTQQGYSVEFMRDQIPRTPSKTEVFSASRQHHLFAPSPQKSGGATVLPFDGNCNWRLRCHRESVKHISGG